MTETNVHHAISNKIYPTTFPYSFLYWVLAISVLPSILNLLGVDFSSIAHGMPVQEMASAGLPKSLLLDQMFYTLTGGLHHGLLEWSAVMAAMLTITLAFAHFAINKDLSTPIIGIALFCSGLMDAFHTLAALRLIDAAAENTDLIPFTWALSRGYNAIILIAGAIICLRLKSAQNRIGLLHISIIAAVFGILAYLSIIYASSSTQLPQTQFKDAWLTRPYDALPLVLFIFAIPVFWTLYRKSTNLLTASLVVALIPEIILEAHMTFGSSSLFDNHFNIAHFLKILAYLIPFMGLLFDYVRTYQQQLETKQLLKEREARLQGIMTHAIDGLISIDEKGVILEVNPACANIFNYDAAEILGNNIKMLMPDPYHGQHDGYLSRYRETQQQHIIGNQQELLGKKKDGTVFPIDLAVSEIKLSNHRIFSGIIRDISDRKDAEDSLLHLNSELEEFAYRTSHDLHSPIKSSIGLLNITKEAIGENDTEKAITSISFAQSSLKKLDDLINDILRLTEIRNKDEQAKHIDISVIIENALEKLAHMEGFSHLEFHKNFGFNEALVTKETRIGMVVENLISNAIKYHDPDKEISYVKISTRNIDNQFILEVKDNGLGVPKDQQQNLFAMFKRFHPKVAFGSGLGLYLIKKSADVLGGEIKFQEHQEGSIFQLIIPL